MVAKTSVMSWQRKTLWSVGKSMSGLLGWEFVVMVVEAVAGCGSIDNDILSLSLRTDSSIVAPLRDVVAALGAGRLTSGVHTYLACSSDLR